MKIKLLILLNLTLAFALDTQAGSATWNLNPINGDWNTAANWTPPTVPNGASDVATFGTSNQTEISLSAPVTVAQITFDTDVKYNITCRAGTSLTFTGFGIRRIDARTESPQTFTVGPASQQPGELPSLTTAGPRRGWPAVPPLSRVPLGVGLLSLQMVGQTAVQVESSSFSIMPSERKRQ